MASLLPENISIKTGDDDLKGIEGFDDDALLMSLLEESQGDHESNEERLRSVIQSLEAEINPSIMSDGYETAMDPAEMPRDGEDTDELPKTAEMESLGLDFELVDMEVVPSSPGDHDMNYWYMEPSENDIVEFGVTNYFQFGHEAAMEEHGYSSLWQESYDITMYN
ncbi:PREDICTED: uncharacterized protein LOC105140446 [Populus euphratica]|uniref:Uncharacterized protein LOC105140446 n=1 Tax=Populus euphratica TaxID=75702 RepID=A0AAJ6VBW8_POPEU|nr:PREDICTED: uncharacterized protein LOC105140446 [Populus euphratica]